MEQKPPQKKHATFPNDTFFCQKSPAHFPSQQQAFVTEGFMFQPFIINYHWDTNY